MRKLVFLAILVLVIGGCQQAAIRQQIAEQQALLQQGKSELEELLRQLRQAKEQAPLRPRLAGKIPVDLRDITFAMMANGDKPTPEEREAILQSAEISLSYQKKIIDLARRYNTSAILISLTDASFTQSNVAALELYQGQLTYGEYLTKMKQLMSAFQSDYAQAVSLLQRQQNEALMQAQQLSAMRSQQALSALQLYNQSLQMLQQGNRTIRCYQVGSYSYCNY